MHGVGGAELQFLSQEITLLAKPSLFISPYGTQQLLAPDSPAAGAATRGQGTFSPSRCARLAAQHSARARGSSRTDVTLRSQELTTSFTPGPQGSCTPIASPALRGTPGVWQPEVPSSDTAWLGSWWERGGRSQEGAGRSLRAPPGSVASVQAEMVSPHVPSEMQV